MRLYVVILLLNCFSDYAGCMTDASISSNLIKNKFSFLSAFRLFLCLSYEQERFPYFSDLFIVCLSPQAAWDGQIP